MKQVLGRYRMFSAAVSKISSSKLLLSGFSSFGTIALRILVCSYPNHQVQLLKMSDPLRGQMPGFEKPAMLRKMRSFIGAYVLVSLAVDERRNESVSTVSLDIYLSVSVLRSGSQFWW